MGRIGRKHYDKAPLPQSMWREHLKDLAKWLLISLAGVFWLVMIVLFAAKGQ